MPRLSVRTTGGTTTARDLLHAGRPVLLDLADDPEVRVAAAGRVDVVTGATDGPAPAALLVRPDGYVAWASDGGADGLAEAVARWVSAARVPATP